MEAYSLWWHLQHFICAHEFDNFIGVAATKEGGNRGRSAFHSHPPTLLKYSAVEASLGDPPPLMKESLRSMKWFRGVRPRLGWCVRGRHAMAALQGGNKMQALHQGRSVKRTHNTCLPCSPLPQRSRGTEQCPKDRI